MRFEMVWLNNFFFFGGGGGYVRNFTIYLTSGSLYRQQDKVSENWVFINKGAETTFVGDFREKLFK